MRSRTTLVTAVLAAIAVAAAVWATVGPFIVRKDAAQLQQQTTSLAQRVSEVCAKGGAAAAELGPDGTCAKAAELRDQPPVAQAEAPVDPAALRQAARTAVAEYCAAPSNPCRGPDGRTPNFDLIVDAVLARVPAPKDGHDGRDAPVPDWGAQIAAYCGQANEPCRGTQGEKGDKGDPPACMAEAAQCRGAEGQPGPTCPPGYELRDAVITAPDHTTYAGKACVDPNSNSAPPSSDPPPLGGS
jgi:hypothetical protein